MQCRGRFYFYSLDLYLPHRLLYALCHMLNLDARVRLDDAQEILLQQRVVQGGKVGPDDGVRGQFCCKDRRPWTTVSLR